jgi:hypothetical protein
MPSERRLPKRSEAKDGNKAKKPRRGGKAGSKAVLSETEEGRVLPTEAATVAVLETAAAEKEAVVKEGSFVAPETAEAGSKAVHSETEEGRVLPTEAATVAVPETAAAEKEAVEKEGSIVAPETAEAEKERSLAAVSEVVANEKERSLVSETVENEKERSLALETLVMDKEVDAGVFMFFSCAVFFLFLCYTAYKLYNPFI